MKFLTGKDYPHLCSYCQQIITDTARALVEGPDTDDNEAPIMYVGDNDMFCGGHTCLDSEYHLKGVRQMLDTYRSTESSAAALKVGHDLNPDRGLSVVAEVLRQLKEYYQIEDKAPEAPTKYAPATVSIRPVATYEIICDWVDRLVAFGKIKEVEEDAITRGDIGDLNTALLAELRSRNPHLEISEL